MSRNPLQGNYVPGCPRVSSWQNNLGSSTADLSPEDLVIKTVESCSNLFSLVPSPGRKLSSDPGSSRGQVHERATWEAGEETVWIKHWLWEHLLLEVRVTFLAMVQCMAAGHHCLRWVIPAVQYLKGPSHGPWQSCYKFVVIKNLRGPFTEYLLRQSGFSQGSGRHSLSTGKGHKPSQATCVIVRKTRKLPGINCSVVSELTTAVYQSLGAFQAELFSKNKTTFTIKWKVKAQ